MCELKSISAETTRDSKRRGGFTLIEILVVVAIIALLVSVLLPALSRARAGAKTVVCTTQIRQLMLAALLYKTDFKERLPGTGRNDDNFSGEYNAGTRTDYLTWLGSWQVSVPSAFYSPSSNVTSKPYWQKMPRNGRLWRYYHDEKMLRCPASENYNGKFSYSTPENVALAMKDPSTDPKGHRDGLPPLLDKIKHPAAAIQFLDEDEDNGMNAYSVDDGFGEPDMFTDRHLGKATVAFFDGHSKAHAFAHEGMRSDSSKPRPKARYSDNHSKNPFEAWMYQIAPFNCNSTPLPWKIRSWTDMPKYRADANWPPDKCTRPGPGCQ